LVRCTAVTLSLAFCATAFADPSKNVVAQKKQVPARKIVVCYIKTIASGIPQPCLRYQGIPTTESPVEVIGRVQ
jgi:hypothetical protein